MLDFHTKLGKYHQIILTISIPAPKLELKRIKILVQFNLASYGLVTFADQDWYFPRRKVV